MAHKHVPLRRCVVCRQQRPQAELIRFVRDEAGQWQLDAGRKAGGRGAWLCHDEGCHKPKKLARFFRAQAGRIHDTLTRVRDDTHDDARGSAPQPSETAAGPSSEHPSETSG
ncbi:MAG: YlxR family protein [Trueperaceae bacterium]|nr:YlxR family protein [Trueperaceae bacterium]